MFSLRRIPFVGRFFSKHNDSPQVTPKEIVIKETIPPNNTPPKETPWRRALRRTFRFVFPRRDTPHIRWSVALLFAAAMFGYFFFTLSHLGKFQTADEDLWYADPVSGRVNAYWHAIENKDWESTRINDKPGVTTAILGYWGYIHDQNPEKKMLDDGNIVDRYDPRVYEQTTYWYQLPFVIVNGALLILFFWLAWRLTKNDIFALLFAGLTALTPILSGLSQIVNPDATIWSFGFASLLAYLVFLKTRNFLWIPLMSIALGLALLSKYGAAFLIFFTFAMTFAYPFFEQDTFHDRKKYANAMIVLLLGWMLCMAGAAGVFALLMPATFAHPEYLAQGTFDFKHAKDVSSIFWSMGILAGTFLVDALLLRGRVLFWILEKLRPLRQPFILLFTLPLFTLAVFTLFNWGWHNHFHFEDVPYDAGTGKEFTKLDLYWKPFLEIKPLVFTTAPVVLFPALLALLLLGWRRHRFSFLLFVFSSFLVFYYAAILVQNILVHGRYSAMLYPAMTALAALFLTLVVERFPQKFRLGIGLLVAVLALALSAQSLVSYFPYQFNYTNPLLPKLQDVTGAWGLGGYEAAQYLNALPLSMNLIVWSDYEGVCPFLRGFCIKGGAVKWYNKGTFSGFDYAVKTRRGSMQSESTWKKLEQMDAFYPDPVWKIEIGGHPKNLVAVYKMRETFDSSALNRDNETPKPIEQKPKPKPVPAPKKEKKK